MWGIFCRWIASEMYSYGLRRDLSLPTTPPAAEIPVHIRPMRLNDLPFLLYPWQRQPSNKMPTDPRRLIEAGLSHAYVAATRSDIPCYMQWLIVPSENEKIQDVSGGALPWLGSDEILLEQGFTLEPFRGLGVMQFAMSRIAETGLEYGARWALTFMDQGNVDGLRECQAAGFRPYLIRRERWRLFRRRISFHLLPRGTPFPFDEKEGTAATDRLPVAG